MRTIAAFLLSLTAVAYASDPVRITGTEVRFTVTKLGFSDVTGHFREFNADIRYDPARPEQSVVRWRVLVASVETGERDRDRAIQSPDYFASTQHPELIFESRTVRTAGDGRLNVTGEITIRGVTRSVTVPVVISDQNGRRMFVSDFEINRYDFDVRGGSVMSRLIGRTVRIHLSATEGAAQ